MDSLINVTNQDGTLVVSSREVAENFEKRHPDTIRAVENLIEETSTQNCTHLFIPSTYQDSYGREQKEYLLTRDGFTLLAMGFTGKKALDWKLKYINAFNKMESALKSLTPEQIVANALIVANSIIQEMDRLLQEQKPKVEFFDTVANSKTALPMDRVAKVLDMGIGRNKLFELLRDKKILDRNNIPYQTYVDRGYFRVVEQKYTKPNGDTVVTTKTLVYQRGINYIRRIVA